MAVTFVAAGTLAAVGTQTVAVVAPACKIGDLVICQLMSKSTAANAISAPDGTWTSLITQEWVDNSDSGGDFCYAAFWKKAVSGTSGASFTFSKATGDSLTFTGVISAWRGCNLAGPIDATAPVRTSTTTAADNVSFPAFDPVTTNAHIVYMAFYGNDLTTFGAAMSADTNPDCTLRYDLETNTGTDATMACISGDTTDGSNIASRTWASASTADSGSVGMVFGLVPAPLGTQMFVRDAGAYDVASVLRRKLLAARGNSVVTGVVNTAASGTNIQWTKTAAGAVMSWMTGKVPVGGASVSGTITFNVWALESTTAANAGMRCRVYQMSVAGALTEISGSPFDMEVELTASSTVQTWYGTPGATINLASGERLVFDFYLTNIGTMGGSLTATLSYDRATGAADGDSYIALSEVIAFNEDFAPAGTKLYLREDNAVFTGITRRKLLTSPNTGSMATSVTNATAGGGPIQTTKTAGGTLMSWVSPAAPTGGLTISGPLMIRLWAFESAATVDTQLTLSIWTMAVGDNFFVQIPGTSTIFNSVSGNVGIELGTAASVFEYWVNVPSTALAVGVRMGLQIGLEGAFTMAVGTVTHDYDGVTRDADGDSFIQFASSIDFDNRNLHRGISVRQAVNRASRY